jgi:hypothetical protein
LAGEKKWQELFSVLKIGRIDGGKVFRNHGNVFQIDGNKFFHQKNKILIKILAGKRSGIAIIAEFRGILSGFPNKDVCICL